MGLFINTIQLDQLKEQLSEDDIVIEESKSNAHVSWAQISWKHSKIA